jgi:hypothetical protein
MAQPTVTNVRFQLRRDTAAAWASALNPVLLAGEPGYDTTNKILKVGDGITAWSLLPSISGGGGQGATGGVSLPTNGTVGDYLSWTGTQWVAGGSTDVRLGGNSSITGTALNNVVVGSSASAVEGDVTIGKSAVSNFKFNVSVGLNAEANGYDVAIGPNAECGGNDVGIGANVVSRGYDVSIGSAASSNGNSVAIGANATSALSGTAVGKSATSNGIEGSVSIGSNSTASSNSSVAVGTGASSNGAYAVALGPLATVADATGAIAIGNLSNIAPGSNGSIIIGNQSSIGSNMVGSILIGASTVLNGSKSIAIVAGNEPGKPGPTFTGSNSCYIAPIRAAFNPSVTIATPIPTGTLWYDPVTSEVCYHVPRD